MRRPVGILLEKDGHVWRSDEPERNISPEQAREAFLQIDAVETTPESDEPAIAWLRAHPERKVVRSANSFGTLASGTFYSSIKCSGAATDTFVTRCVRYEHGFGWTEAATLTAHPTEDDALRPYRGQYFFATLLQLIDFFAMLPLEWNANAPYKEQAMDIEALGPHKGVFPSPEDSPVVSICCTTKTFDARPGDETFN